MKRYLLHVERIISLLRKRITDDAIVGLLLKALLNQVVAAVLDGLLRR